MRWTPKTGQSTKLLSAVREGGTDGAETEVAHGDVQGSGGVGGRQGREDGQRTGEPSWRSSDDDPCLEEAARRECRGGVPDGHEVIGGRAQGPAKAALRADRSAQDGAGLAQKKSCQLRLRPSVPGSILWMPC